MRSLAIYLKNYRKESILAPFFKFLEVVFDLLVPVVIAQIIDVGITGNNRPYIIQRFFILVLRAAAGLTVSITAQYFAAKASVGFATELRQAVYDHVQKLSYTELDTLGTDTLITRLTDDINQVQNLSLIHIYIHDPHSKTGHDDHHKNSGKIIPHHHEVYRMFCDDLVDCIAEQYRDIQLKDHGNRSQDDA